MKTGLEPLGLEIAKRRAGNKLTLRDAAKLTGLSHETIAQAEKGLASLETAVKIAKRLGVPFRVLQKCGRAYVTYVVEDGFGDEWKMFPSRTHAVQAELIDATIKLSALPNFEVDEAVLQEFMNDEQQEAADRLTGVTEFDKRERAGNPCNFCMLRDIRSFAGTRPVELIEDDYGGRWPDGMEVRVGGSFVGWFMKIPDGCVC